MALAEVYIDESYPDKGPRFLCVAGYLYRKRKAQEFSRDWANYLKREKLPYFHMTEAAAARTGYGIFAGDEAKADRVERELIKRVQTATEFGFATTLNEDEYNEIIGPREGMRSAYATALLSAIMHVRNWCERSNFSGEIAYFFEAGHPHQRDANAFMNWLFESPRLRGLYRYGGHAFVKKETPGLHPADLLAWQWSLESMRRQEPERRYKTRGDFKALVRKKDVYTHWARDRWEQAAQGLIEGEEYRAEVIQRFHETGELPPPHRLGETHDWVLKSR